MLITDPTSRGEHVPTGGAHAVEDAGLHDRDRVVPVLVGHVLRAWPDPADAGVVDDDVDRPKSRATASKVASTCSLRHVRRIRTRLDAQRGELAGGLLARRLVDLGDGDRGALLRELLGDACGRVRACAGDDGHPPSSTPAATHLPRARVGGEHGCTRRVLYRRLRSAGRHGATRKQSFSRLTYRVGWDPPQSPSS